MYISTYIYMEATFDIDLCIYICVIQWFIVICVYTFVNVYMYKNDILMCIYTYISGIFVAVYKYVILWLILKYIYI